MGSWLANPVYSSREQNRNFLLILFLIAIPLHIGVWPYVESALLHGFGKTVQITVLSASVQRDVRSRSMRAVYIPRVRYSFELNGRMWESSNYACSEPDLEQFHASRIVQQLSEAKPQYAWVVPWRPQISAIDPNAHREVLLAATLVIDALILILAYPLWRTRARRGRPPRA